MLITRKTFRRIATVSVALVTAGLLASCNSYPGDAAVTNDKRVTTSQVADVQQDLTHIGYASMSPYAISTTLAASSAADNVAKDAGLAASDQQGLELLQQIAKNSGVDVTGYNFAPSTIELARVSAEMTSVQAAPDASKLRDEFSRQARAANVKVNPRFGAVDSNEQVVAYPFPWLVPTASAG